MDPELKLVVYQILHVGSAFLLTALTFRACANPHPAKRKGTMILGGLLSLFLLVGGFGLLAVLKYGWPMWVLVKVVCWLALSALAGMAFRRPKMGGMLTLVTTVIVLVAVFAVYTKLFEGAPPAS